MVVTCHLRGRRWISNWAQRLRAGLHLVSLPGCLASPVAETLKGFTHLKLDESNVQFFWRLVLCDHRNYLRKKPKDQQVKVQETATPKPLKLLNFQASEVFSRTLDVPSPSITRCGAVAWASCFCSTSKLMWPFSSWFGWRSGGAKLLELEPP